MTIVFPRPMPSSGVAQQEFDIQRVDFAAPTADGRVGGVQGGFPLWIATWTLGRISRVRGDEWTAWLDSLRGAQKRFLGRDFSRPYPLAYLENGFAGMTRAGGGAFTGAATSWSQSIDGNGGARLTLNGLPNGLVLSWGDYVGLKWDANGSMAGAYDRRTMARVVDPATAAVSGTVTVGIEPPIPPWVNAGAVAHLDMPAAVMTLITDGTKRAPIDRRLTIQGTKISAVQDLRP